MMIGTFGTAGTIGTREADLIMRRVGAFANHDHAVLMNHNEFATVGFLQYLRIEYIVRTSLGN